MLWQIQSIPTVAIYQGSFDITPPIAAPYDLQVTTFEGGPPWIIEFAWEFDYGEWSPSQFEIQRNIDGGAFSILGTVDAPQQFFTDNLGPVPPPPPIGSILGYQVRYKNGGDVGPWSATVFQTLSPV